MKTLHWRLSTEMWCTDVPSELIKAKGHKAATVWSHSVSQKIGAFQVSVWQTLPNRSEFLLLRSQFVMLQIAFFHSFETFQLNGVL